jgi:hypothetical protein
MPEFRSILKPDISWIQVTRDIAQASFLDVKRTTKCFILNSEKEYNSAKGHVNS